MAPHKDKVLVTFVQAKSQLDLPWTKVKMKVIEDACLQLISDIETFKNLASHFLTADQFKMITFNTCITMSDLSKFSEAEICTSCRETNVFDEKKDGQSGNKYSVNQLRALFGQPSRQEAATSEADNLFKLLSAIYVGGGSLVKLRYLTEKYEEENYYLTQVDRTMQGAMKGEESLDENLSKSLHNVKTKVHSKWISRNKNIKLSPAQNNLYQSGIGLKDGYCMIGGHGTKQEGSYRQGTLPSW